MRLWSLHPSMLDTQGLVALWREALGAQKALLYLEQNTKFGYQNHPQLQRFKDSNDPVSAIVAYLHGVHEESIARKYAFNAGLILPLDYAHVESIPVTKGQLEYEQHWLISKLEVRSPHLLPHAQVISLHPLFHEVSGDIEAWEKISL